MAELLESKGVRLIKTYQDNKKRNNIAWTAPDHRGAEKEDPTVGLAEMTRKVYEVDPLTYPKCQGQMRTIAFITDYSLIDRIINHLKLSFAADKPPPPRIAFQELLMAAETGGDYFS